MQSNNIENGRIISGAYAEREMFGVAIGEKLYSVVVDPDPEPLDNGRYIGIVLDPFADCEAMGLPGSNERVQAYVDLIAWEFPIFEDSFIADMIED